MDPDPEVGAVDREMRCTRVAALGPGDRTRVLVTNAGVVRGRGGRGRAGHSPPDGLEGGVPPQARDVLADGGV